MKVLIFSKSTWNILNFRKNLLKKMIEYKWEVYILATPDIAKQKIESMGCRIIPIEINNKRINPIVDLILFFKVFKVYYSIKPDVACHFNIKPVIYGMLIARLVGVRQRYAMITGLGYTFISSTSFRKFTILSIP